MLVKEKLKKCLKEGERGERHKGLKRIEISEDKVRGHLEKANKNFHAIEDFRKAGYSDWSPSAAFYSLYHLLLALLAKYGIESRNQSCTLAFVEDLIDTGKASISKADLKEILDREIEENLEHSDKILDLREVAQYSTKTSMEDREFENMKNRTKMLFNKIKREVEK